MKALIAGITGLAGSAAAEELLRRGHEVVGLARDPTRARSDIRVVKGDVLSGEGLDEALDGVDAAYYLVHAIESGAGDPYQRDLRGAENFVATLRRSGVKRAVYVGMYEAPHAEASPHLRSRLEVERRIVEATPDSISLRAPLLIGPGSSFQLFDRIISRSLVIPLGNWCKNRQAVLDTRDLARYLADAGEAGPGIGGCFDLPAGETIRFDELVRRMARARGLRRVVVPLPFSDRRLSPLVGVLSGMGATFARSLMTVPAAGEQLPDPADYPPFLAPDDQPRPLDRALADLYAGAPAAAKPVPAAMLQAREDVVALASMERRAATLGEATSARWVAGRLEEIGAQDVRLLGFRSPTTWGWSNATYAALGLAASFGGRLGRIAAAALAASFERDYTGRSHWLRRFLPAGESTSVSATIPATGAPRRKLILVAHHDAAHTGLVWQPAFTAGARSQARRRNITPSYIGLPLGGMLMIAAGERRLRALGRGLLGSMVVLAAQAGRSRTVPGANDNATGVAGVLELAQRLVGEPLPDTEVQILVPGAEEIGNGGMYAWMREQGRRLDTEKTLVVGLDAIGSGRPVLSARESVTGRYREADLELAELAAGDAGISNPPRVGLGAPTDTLLTAHAGLPTVSILSWNEDGIANLHLPSDTPENVDWRCVEQCVDWAQAIVLRWIGELPGSPTTAADKALSPA